jgi:hypothetical protein
MVYRVVEFQDDSTDLIAELTDDEWRAPGGPDLAEFLDLAADPRAFGPMHGDPIACAIGLAARLLKGEGRVVRWHGPGESRTGARKPSGS